MNQRPAIEVKDLVKTYGHGDDAVEAVRGVSFHVETGEIYALLGPNGAGKTTTLLTLITLLHPTAGSATVAGVDVASDPHQVRRRVGSALQETGLDSPATGRETLYRHARLLGLTGNAALERVEGLLQLVGLVEAADRKVRTYSGGMKRRLDLALAIVHQPEIVFLDEPTTGLDPASRRAIWAEVEKLRRGGMTVMLTTQYLEEADALADRVAIIDDGLLVAEGTPAELKQRLGGEVVVVTFHSAEDATAAAGMLDAVTAGTEMHLTVPDGAGAVPGIVQRLQRDGLDMASLTVHEPTLDDVFLEVTGHRLEGAAATETAQ